MRSSLLKATLAILVGIAWLSALLPAEAAPLFDDQTHEPCPGCVASASPASLHFPALPPATCGVVFNIYSVDGACHREIGEPPGPCLEKKGCYFWYQVLCQGQCGNVVPALFSLGNTSLPLWTPCGTNQGLGTLPCGYSINASFLVWDVTTGATAVKRSTLTCTQCDSDDASDRT